MNLRPTTQDTRGMIECVTLLSYSKEKRRRLSNEFRRRHQAIYRQRRELHRRERRMLEALIAVLSEFRWEKVPSGRK